MRAASPATAVPSNRRSFRSPKMQKFAAWQRTELLRIGDQLPKGRGQSFVNMMRPSGETSLWMAWLLTYASDMRPEPGRKYAF